MQWEYMVVNLRYSSIEAELNHYGKIGWQMDWLIEGTEGQVRLILRRQKPGRYTNPETDVVE